MDSVFIREIKIPARVRAFTMLDPDGDYNIYLNCDLSEQARQKSLMHEFEHIKNNDFRSPEFACEIELLRKRYE